MECPECGKEMILRDGRYGKFWGCSDFPNCSCKHGAHPNGTPMGIPGNKEVRELRMDVHHICEQIWGKWGSEHCDKIAMYKWFRNNAPKGHIAHMLKEDLLETKRLLMAHYGEPPKQSNKLKKLGLRDNQNVKQNTNRNNKL